jgi:hypothetical protein
MDNTVNRWVQFERFQKRYLQAYTNTQSANIKMGDCHRIVPEHCIIVVGTPALYLTFSFSWLSSFSKEKCCIPAVM